MNRTQHVITRSQHIIRNEQGYVLVMSLLMLVVLSIMGTAAMTVRNTEVAIATNSEIIQHNFYALEAVTLEGSTRFERTDMENFLSDLFSGEPVVWSTFPWLKANDPDFPPVIDLSRASEWSSVSAEQTHMNELKPPGFNAAADDRIQYAALQGNLHSDSNDYELCAGSDLSDPNKREACFSVYGRYDIQSGAGKGFSGRRMMMVGYKKTVYLNNP
ncbi:MAG: hypothetical protein GXY53_09220 [Desulfobulbus sp.]|nr:hypothetical protein [Desulfobulbus sp.]